ncbi:hypothetical protein COX93_03410 [Candidatus Nomurabacteria bacterium CG_4_10_14_0_2_um_filter_30_12]|uniref:DUF4190 domain-containing protein n=2 Tax=Candidatus Nomuraibacteriota TaxID=1752729 RepID=A0A2J0MGK7_9BACT|nr:MAG: hypothetical protein COU48_01175 [Candidatus Nomurabacteria bacterium CG10_big_fil_rev_8_21_14_0_10_03_31_7]PIZ86727.1 MAG: hypothetical protein COX93_03410 [Candidatus Nomurabacteria bacterium CG_4_10_14_0_2_um_filter_30_12]
MKKKLIVLSSSVLGFMPFVVFAQVSTGCSDPQYAGKIQGILCTIGNILDTIIPILVVLGVVYFVYGVVMFVIASEEEAKTKGRNSMIYGIIGLVVIIAMWGLVGIVMRTFNVDNTGTLPGNIPSVSF